MSDTPETDAEKFFSDHHGYYVVHAEHAEDLERERDEARKKTQWKQGRIEVLLRLNQKLHSELAEPQDDDLQAELAAWELLDEARRERDEWKEVAEGGLLGAIKERDEAVRSRKDSAADWLNQINNADLRVARIKSERDHWRAEAERWREVSK